MKKFMLILFVLLWWPAVSKADPNRSSQSLAIYGAGPFTAGLSGGIQYVYSPKRMPDLGLGVEISQIPHQFEWDSKSRMALAEIRFAKPQGRYRTFLFAGVGGQRTHNRLVGGPFGVLNPFPSSWPDTGTLESRTLIDDSSSSWAAAWGMGIDIYLTNSIFIGSELRDTIFGPTHFQATPAGQLIGIMTDYPTMNQIRLLFRAGIKWG